MEKSAEAFRTISEVADLLETPAHVLRFWESRFPQIRPVKRAGGRRYYRPADVGLLTGIKRLLHDEGLTIRGVQKILREQGVQYVSGVSAIDVAEALPQEGAFVVQDMAAPSESAIILEYSERRVVLAQAPVLTTTDTEMPPPLRPTPADPPPEVADIATQDTAETVNVPPEAGLLPQPAALAATGPDAAAESAPESWAQADLFVAAQPAAPDAPATDPVAASAPLGGPWLPTLLRGLPPAALHRQRAALLPLHARLVALRDAMAQAGRAGH